MRVGKQRRGDAGGRDILDSRILGDKVFANAALRERKLAEKAHVSMPLSDLLKVVSSLLRVEPGLIRRPSKIRYLAKARGIASYVAIRELGYKGMETGKEPKWEASGSQYSPPQRGILLAERQEIRPLVAVSAGHPARIGGLQPV